MTREIIKYSLRIDNDSYLKIQHIANDNSRSINGQLDYIIRAFIKDYEKIKGEIKT